MLTKKQRYVISTIFVIFIVLIIVDLLLPRGNVFEGEVRRVSEDSVEFLYDLTYEDENGSVIYDQQIFDKVFEIIDNAESFVILDMFLFGVSSEKVYRNLTQELTDHLLNKKYSNPNITIFFITDYYNTFAYGDEHLKELKEAGVEVIFSSSSGKRVLGDENFIDFLSKKFLSRLNHRKSIVADSGNKIVSLITSGNPHDASSPNSNVGFYFEEGIWKDIYGFKKNSSLIDGLEIDSSLNGSEGGDGKVFIQYLANGALMLSLEEEIDKTVEGDSLDILIFYLSDKKIINSLSRAVNRGVEVRIIFDLNIESFGKNMNGIPNKPVAEELIKKTGGDIEIRWYLSHGEQFHTKMAIFNKRNEIVVFLGSSNFGKNDKIFYNLQSDVKVVMSINSSIVDDVNSYFSRLWLNKNGVYTSDYEEFKDDSFLKMLRYEFGQILANFF